MVACEETGQRIFIKLNLAFHQDFKFEFLNQMKLMKTIRTICLILNMSTHCILLLVKLTAPVILVIAVASPISNILKLQNR
jgi:hypothetical protein